MLNFKKIEGVESIDHLLNIVAFCALMENNGGIANKSPDYIVEKFLLYVMDTENNFTSIGGLDNTRQKIVMEWAEKWAKVVPNIHEALKEYNKKYGKGE